ncbi:Bug family tripartite tricarboxylate transporter substrate binding protein [Pseudorhodoferax sp.]|uniref:Bug family tripartite tricarboxylate transporter substrate binding protein n=1 Tax=Pseudorhodoferax sp. TaxID=1993553 RepID=UPI0039E29E7E
MNKRQLLQAFGAAALLAQSNPGTAAIDFPTRPVTIVVPYAAGGPTDGHTRVLAAKLSQMWGQPVVVENRGGAGTLIGTQYVSKSAPDGHTLLFTAYAYTSNPILRPTMPYAADALKPLVHIGSNALILFVSGRSAMKNLKDVVSRAKAGPGQLRLASSGNASSPHIALELLGRAIDAQILHLPYRGAAPAKNDVIAGVVDGIFDGSSSMPLARSGALRAIAIASERRHPQAPEVPTFRELGVDLLYATWYGMLIPSATPPAIEGKLNADIRTALSDPAVKAAIAETGVQLSPGTPQQFAAFLQAESRKLQALVDSGVRIEVE